MPEIFLFDVFINENLKEMVVNYFKKNDIEFEEEKPKNPENLN